MFLRIDSHRKHDSKAFFDIEDFGNNDKFLSYSQKYIKYVNFVWKKSI